MNSGIMRFFTAHRSIRPIHLAATASILFTVWQNALAQDKLPISDAHIHYSHDSVEMTPPERVIELMREANLKLALVSSSDDKGTQLLVNLAPDLIVPGLRPYSRRGQLSTWYTDQENLAYVENLLAENRYASIGEFHLYGETADLPIPRRIVELAAEHNLILHAHSDAEAVERLLAQNPSVKVIWAHAGFDDPEFVSEVLAKHDRLWTDLAFRGEVGSGGSLSQEWRDLFDAHPDRIMLGTDTYTPERMYFVPSHAESARVWLDTLPKELAEKIAWKNAYDLIMPVWKENSAASADTASKRQTAGICQQSLARGGIAVNQKPLTVVHPQSKIEVSEPFTVLVNVCGENLAASTVALDATMPTHGHGMNYTPDHKILEQGNSSLSVRVEGVRLHMPGKWQWAVNLRRERSRITSTYDFIVD